MSAAAGRKEGESERGNWLQWFIARVCLSTQTQVVFFNKKAGDASVSKYIVVLSPFLNI
jgi:hypothetical protein